MEQMAINIALIPEDKVKDLSISLNKDLVDKGSKLILGNNAVPHITLLQGVLDQEQINIIGSILESEAQEYGKMSLIIDGFYFGPMSKAIWLNVKKDNNIDSLHRKIIDLVEPYLYYNVDKSMFADPNEIEDVFIKWVQDFISKSSLDDYKPHITLGFGKLEDIANKVNFPIEFKASKLAMYQLGKYCTCSKEILSYDLYLFSL